MRVRSQQRIFKTEAVSDNGMVTAMHPLAAEAGVDVLERGGRAADAAVATAFALGVVEPFMSGLGGSAYAVVYDAPSGRTSCFDGSVVVPAEGREDMFELAPDDEPRSGVYGWRATRGDAAETGHRSIAVPGALRALEALHRAHGALSWSELVAPAIELAEEGFDVDEYVFTQSALSHSRLRAFPATLNVFFHPDGHPLVPDRAGSGPDRLRQPALARTLKAIAREGADVLYRGRLARPIIEHVREGGGILSEDDLTCYRARALEPLLVRYRERQVALLSGTSGGPTVGMALQLLDGFDVPALAPDSVTRLHILAETMRLSFEDRFRFLGDPATVSVPFDGLLSSRYADDRRKFVSPEGVYAPELPPGEPWLYEPRRPTRTLPGSGDATSQHTTHLNVVDREGGAVALTATLGARFGSGVTVPELGVVLNNGMMWFDPEPGRINSIRPRQRALHAAAPCIVFGDGRPVVVLGAPGARKIMTAVLQVLSYLLDHGMGIQEAVTAPRIHCDRGRLLLIDERFPSPVQDELRRRGHDATERSEGFLSSFFGRPSAIGIDAAPPRLRSGVEPYRAGTAVGY